MEIGKTLLAIVGGIGLLIFAGLILSNGTNAVSILDSVLAGTLNETKALQMR